jgi:MFS family permease
LPESFSPQQQTLPARRLSLVNLAALRDLGRYPGVRPILLIAFNSILWFAGVQAIFRLFTLDAFGMSVEGTGRVFGLIGLISVLVQGGLIGRLTRRFGEIRLLYAALILMAVGLALHGISVPLGVPAFLVASSVAAVGTALHMPCVSSYISRRVGPEAQGATLGLMQSAGALARALGPLLWGLLYDSLGLRLPFYIAAVAIGALVVLLPRLPRL